MSVDVKDNKTVTNAPVVRNNILHVYWTALTDDTELPPLPTFKQKTKEIFHRVLSSMFIIDNVLDVDGINLRLETT